MENRYEYRMYNRRNIYRIYMYKSLIIIYLKTFSLVKRTSHLLLFYYLLIFLVILKPIQKSLFLIKRIFQRRFGIRNKPQLYRQNIKRVDILLVRLSVATNYKNLCIPIWMISKLSLIIVVSIEKIRMAGNKYMILYKIQLF